MSHTRLAALLIAALAPFALLASVRGQQPPASGYTWEIVDLGVDGGQGLLDLREVDERVAPSHASASARKLVRVLVRGRHDPQLAG